MAGIWVETQSQVTSPHCAAQAISPAVRRWRRSCWNSRWIFSAYPGSHGRIIPKAFQELDPGSLLSQLMLALQIGICPNRSEAGHELCFILAIVRCFFACCLRAPPYGRRASHARFRSRHQRACRCSQQIRARSELHNCKQRSIIMLLTCAHAKLYAHTGEEA